MFTRRGFVKIGALAAFGGFFSSLTGKVFGQDLILPKEVLGDPLLTLSSDHFKQFVKTTFLLRRPEIRRASVLTLLSVDQFASEGDNSKRVSGESFSLIFKSFDGDDFPQGIYQFSHVSLGEFSMFIAPVSLDPHYFEAVINHRLN